MSRILKFGASSCRQLCTAGVFDCSMPWQRPSSAFRLQNSPQPTISPSCNPPVYVGAAIRPTAVAKPISVRTRPTRALWPQADTAVWHPQQAVLSGRSLASGAAVERSQMFSGSQDSRRSAFTSYRAEVPGSHRAGESGIVGAMSHQQQHIYRGTAIRPWEPQQCQPKLTVRELLRAREAAAADRAAADFAFQARSAAPVKHRRPSKNRPTANEEAAAHREKRRRVDGCVETLQGTPLRHDSNVAELPTFNGFRVLFQPAHCEAADQRSGEVATIASQPRRQRLPIAPETLAADCELSRGRPSSISKSRQMQLLECTGRERSSSRFVAPADSS